MRVCGLITAPSSMVTGPPVESMHTKGCTSAVGATNTWSFSPHTVAWSEKVPTMPARPACLKSATMASGLWWISSQKYESTVNRIS